MSPEISIETEWRSLSVSSSLSEHQWAQTGLGCCMPSYETQPTVHIFQPCSWVWAYVCVCVSSASRNVCTPPILRWLPKTKMAARTPEKEKERESDRDGDYMLNGEKRDRLALSPPFSLLFFCLCGCICPNLYTLSIKSCWHGPVCSLITHNRPINTSTSTHAHAACHKLCW